MGQYEDWDGVFCKSAGRRDGEYQGGIKHKDEKLYGGMCPVITTIPKYVSQHGVSMPNHRGGRCLL